jgi:hypothetical protein
MQKAKAEDEGETGKKDIQLWDIRYLDNKLVGLSSDGLE